MTRVHSGRVRRTGSKSSRASWRRFKTSRKRTQGSWTTWTTSAYELSERGGSLHLEEHLIVVIGDLDVQVFTLLIRLLSDGQ